MTDVLADLEALISGMPEGEKAELDRLLEPELKSAWLPNPGPQTSAYESRADILLYGGAAGGGKTDLLLGLALTKHERSVIFRRAYVDLRGVEERLIGMIGSRDGYNGADMILRRDGRLLEFGALEKPGAEFSWQGRPHDLIGFDEGAQLAEAKVRFVMGWLRTTTAGQRCRVVIASNPPIGGEGEWLVRWFAPWLDDLYPNPAAPGELRWAVTDASGETVWVDGPGVHVVGGQELEALSRTFIPARLDDNPYLSGTNYRAQVQSLPEPLRSKLLEGDFLAGAEDAENQVIPSAWVEAAQARWNTERPSERMLAIGVDVAQGGVDETVLAPLYGNWFSELIKKPGVDTKNGPSVAALVIEHMRDKCHVAIDMTGGWGGSARDHLEAQGIKVYPVVFSSGTDAMTKDRQLEFLNVRAEMYWKFREALDPVSGDNIALPPDRRLKAQLCAPTWKLRGKSIVIESKEDLRKRLGASTDDADAVVMAWHRRGHAMIEAAWKARPLRRNLSRLA